MANNQVSFKSSASTADVSATTLPDLNAETYPFEVVQNLLDQAAYFNFYSTPEQKKHNVEIIHHQSGKVIGFNIREQLHRFVIKMHPEDGKGLKAVNRISEQMGRFSSRWLIIPDDFAARPAIEPPITKFDSSRSQRFVMLDGVCKFGDGADSFYGFGAGCTYPVTENGQHKLLVAAVGNITVGFGKFAGLEGTYTYCGSLMPERGFVGNLLCRVIDADGVLNTGKTITESASVLPPEKNVAYLLFRGQKKDRSQKTEYRFGSAGEVIGLNVHQQLREFYLDASAKGRGGAQTEAKLGTVIGSMQAAIIFNLLNPGAPGTSDAPIAFQSFNEFSFFNSQGENLGIITADGSEGRTFKLKLKNAPGQTALRFGGFGRLIEGTGQFAGIQGLMSDNSVVGIAPHAISTLYVIRVSDPEGKYRMA